MNVAITKLKRRDFSIKRGDFTKKNTEALIIELRNVLLKADIPYTYIMLLLRKLKIKLASAENEKTSKSTIIGGILKSNIEDTFLSSKGGGINVKKRGTTTIGIYGSNGVGKTSFAVKLANFLQKKHNKISMCVSFDTKTASQQQLKIACKHNNIEYLNLTEFNNLNKGLIKINEIIKYGMVDILIVDNAGCSPDDTGCIATWKKTINNINYDEKIIVFDAMYGQNASLLIKEYCKIVNPTGFAVSKMDSNQKGGMFFSIAVTSDKPIYYILDGEKIHNIHEFNKKMVVTTLFKIAGLKEAIKSFQLIDKNRIYHITKQFNYNDLLQYLERFLSIKESNNKIYSILLKMKFKNDIEIAAETLSLIKKWMSIINSMTPFERANFERLNISRIDRIAHGSGVSRDEIIVLQKKIEEINRMI